MASNLWLESRAQPGRRRVAEGPRTDGSVSRSYAGGRLRSTDEQTDRPRPSGRPVHPNSLFPGLCMSWSACLCVSVRSPLSVSPVFGFPHLSVTRVSQIESQTHTQAPSAFLDTCCPSREPQHGHGGPYQTPKRSGLGGTEVEANCPGHRAEAWAQEWIFSSCKGDRNLPGRETGKGKGKER